jgi:hypothetical protein
MQVVAAWSLADTSAVYGQCLVPVTLFRQLLTSVGGSRTTGYLPATNQLTLGGPVLTGVARACSVVDGITDPSISAFLGAVAVSTVPQRRLRAFLRLWWRGVKVRAAMRKLRIVTLRVSGGR